MSYLKYCWMCKCNKFCRLKWKKNCFFINYCVRDLIRCLIQFNNSFYCISFWNLIQKCMLRKYSSQHHIQQRMKQAKSLIQLIVDCNRIWYHHIWFVLSLSFFSRFRCKCEFMVIRHKRLTLSNRWHCYNYHSNRKEKIIASTISLFLLNWNISLLKNGFNFQWLDILHQFSTQARLLNEQTTNKIKSC